MRTRSTAPPYPPSADMGGKALRKKKGEEVRVGVLLGRLASMLGKVDLPITAMRLKSKLLD